MQECWNFFLIYFYDLYSKCIKLWSSASGFCNREFYNGSVNSPIVIHVLKNVFIYCIPKSIWVKKSANWLWNFSFLVKKRISCVNRISPVMYQHRRSTIEKYFLISIMNNINRVFCHHSKTINLLFRVFKSHRRCQVGRMYQPLFCCLLPNQNWITCRWIKSEVLKI